MGRGGLAAGGGGTPGTAHGGGSGCCVGRETVIAIDRRIPNALPQGPERAVFLAGIPEVNETVGEGRLLPDNQQDTKRKPTPRTVLIH